MIKIFLLIFVNFHQFLATQICIYIDIIISILMRYKLLIINFFKRREHVNINVLYILHRYYNKVHIFSEFSRVRVLNKAKSIL